MPAADFRDDIHHARADLIDEVGEVREPHDHLRRRRGCLRGGGGQDERNRRGRGDRDQCQGADALGQQDRSLGWGHRTYLERMRNQRIGTGKNAGTIARAYCCGGGVAWTSFVGAGMNRGANGDSGAVFVPLRLP
jgi:hypothetical protein